MSKLIKDSEYHKNDEELNSLSTKGRELLDAFKNRHFLSYPDLQKFCSSSQEKINSLNALISTVLKRYPNNDENAILIMILGSYKISLKKLEKISEINGTVYSNKFFKKASLLCDLAQKEHIGDCLSIFSGSLNMLEFYLKENLTYQSRSLAPIA